MYSSFLLNSQEDVLLGRMILILRCFDFLSTDRYGDYLILSEQFKNVIKLFGFLLKKYLKSLDIAIEYSWYGWTNVLKIYFAAGMASEITMIQAISCN